MTTDSKVRVTLDIIVNEDDSDVVVEMLGQFADNARARLSEFYTDADIILATDDGIHETH